MPEQKKTEWATIGKIVAPFGLRGEMKVFSLSDVPDRFTQLDGIYLAPDYKRVAIEGVRPFKGDMVLLKLRGIDDATTADELRGVDVSIPLEDLAKLPPDSYYQHDILGLQVLTLGGREVGPVTDILPTGANDVYVVTEVSGRQFLIPAIKACIKQIDLHRRTMYIDPIAGLIDDDYVAGDEAEHATEGEPESESEEGAEENE